MVKSKHMIDGDIHYTNFHFGGLLNGFSVGDIKTQTYAKNSALGREANQ